MLVALLAVTLSVASAIASPSNKWRIQVSGGADSDGTIVLNVAPVDEPMISVTVEVPRGTSENDVARRIRDAFRSQVGDRYIVEVDDGEDVLVKRQMGGQNFDLSATGNTVEGVRLSFDRE
jgi:hypothetical protein